MSWHQWVWDENESVKYFIFKRSHPLLLSGETCSRQTSRDIGDRVAVMVANNSSFSRGRKKQSHGKNNSVRSSKATTYQIKLCASEKQTDFMWKTTGSSLSASNQEPDVGVMVNSFRKTSASHSEAVKKIPKATNETDIVVNCGKRGRLLLTAWTSDLLTLWLLCVFLDSPSQ